MLHVLPAKRGVSRLSSALLLGLLQFKRAAPLYSHEIIEHASGNSPSDRQPRASSPSRAPTGPQSPRGLRELCAASVPSVFRLHEFKSHLIPRVFKRLRTLSHHAEISPLCFHTLTHSSYMSPNVNSHPLNHLRALSQKHPGGGVRCSRIIQVLLSIFDYRLCILLYRRHLAGLGPRWAVRS